MSFINIFIPILLLAVLVVLGLGLHNLVTGGSPNRSQSLMRLRILFQGIAVAAIVLAFYVASRH